jgi:hypothetical protein
MAETDSTRGDDDAPTAPSHLADALVEGEGGRDLVAGFRRSIHRRQLSGHAVELFVEGFRDLCLKYLRLFFQGRP